MNAEQAEQLQDIFCEVLERVAFLFAEPAPGEEVLCADQTFYRVDMTFSGSTACGTLSLLAPHAFCLELAANVLGLEEDDEEMAEHAQDTLKELLNVTCGRWLTAVAGDEPIFDLSVPEVRDVNATSWEEARADPVARLLLIDETPVILTGGYTERDS